MYRFASVAILSVVLSLDGVLAQDFSVENAQTEAKYNCKCVRYFQCKNNTVDIFGVGLVERRLAVPTIIPCKFNSIVPNDLICCKLNDTITTESPASRNPDVEVTLPPTGGILSCGASSQPPTKPRIFTPTSELTPVDGEFPWIAAVFYRRNGTFRCGGTLIHPKVILTANHCVYNKKNDDFIVGANGRIDLPIDSTERRDVSKIISHPKYINAHNRLFNDAALLILESPFPSGRKLNNLCLPPPQYNLDGKKCIVVGWGDDNEGQRRNTLKMVDVPFVNRNQCQNDLRKTDLGKNFILHTSFMCAGGEEGKDSCVGDGGGPLMCELPSDSSRYFQAGIVSWGIGCGMESVPGVYVDVSTISPWIENELRNI